MADSKKVSFGFQKLNKKRNILPNIVKYESNVQYIDCVEEKAIKVKDAEDVIEEKLLVIPLLKDPNLKTFVKSEAKPVNNLVQNSVSIPVNEPESLDTIAAREILEDLQKAKKKREDTQVYTVPLTNNPPAGEKESSLDDYETVPIVDFGLAMLRGMGWKEGKGIGKNEKMVSTSLPTLRPKGMGLGADKVVKAEPSENISKDELVLKIGSCVRIIAGPHKDCYGQVEGFDEISSRVIVKLILAHTTVSFNEFMVQVVTKEDFNKNSKVINVAKFEEYKEKESQPISDELVETETRSGSSHSKVRYDHKVTEKRRTPSEESSSSSKDSNQLNFSRMKKQRSSSDTSSSHSDCSGVLSRRKHKSISTHHRKHNKSSCKSKSASRSPERRRRHSSSETTSSSYHSQSKTSAQHKGKRTLTHHRRHKSKGHSKGASRSPERRRQHSKTSTKRKS